MPTDRSRSFGDAVIGGVITVIGSAVLILATGAWSAKENTADHKGDVQALNAKIQRVLDVVCLDKPAAPQCRPSSGGGSP